LLVASGGFEPSNAEQSDLQTDTNGARALVFTGLPKVSGHFVPDTCQINFEGDNLEVLPSASLTVYLRWVNPSLPTMITTGPCSPQPPL